MKLGELLIRSVLVYLGLVTVMKLMGKRQVGELRISELVTTLLLSELAAVPITEPDVPLWQAVLPPAVILLLEFAVSFLMLKSPVLRNILEGKPSELIRNGKPDWKELKRSRVTLDELLSELRLNGVFEPEQVWSATLEQNGRVSVALRSAHRPLTPADIGLNTEEDGVAHTVVREGGVRAAELAAAKRDFTWLSHYLSAKHIRQEDVLLLTVTDSGRIFLAAREEGDGKRRSESNN